MHDAVHTGQRIRTLPSQPGQRGLVLPHLSSTGMGDEGGTVATLPLTFHQLRWDKQRTELMKVMELIRLLQQGGPNMDVKVDLAGREYDVTLVTRQESQTMVLYVGKTKSEGEEEEHEPEPRHEEPEETGKFGKGFKEPKEPKTTKNRPATPKKKGYKY